MKSPLGLYIHIPFCRSKCQYCDFCSFAPKEEEIVQRYIDALILQMEDNAEVCRPYNVDSIYIGGGTPTYLDVKDLCRILDAVNENFRVDRDAEITVECNPATVDRKYLTRLRRRGVNRLSLGLQSTFNNELAALGRIHNYEDFIRTFEDARAAGFDNISVDLMYGIPEQTEDSFTETLNRLIALSPEHLSLYALKIEDGTPFAEKKDSLPLPNDDTQFNMYITACDTLRRSGYEQYEISNFSKPGYASLHNLKYWHCDDYLGLGINAASYLDGERFQTIRDIDTYIEALEVMYNDIDIEASRQKITSGECMDEYVMLGMRLVEGVNAREFEERFHVSFEEKYGARLRAYVEDGFVISDGKGTSFRFSPKGMFVSNYILSDVLSLGSD